MKATLLNEDYIKQQYLIAVKSARVCYDSKSDSTDEIGDKDRQLMRNLMKAKHETIFEHIDVVFHIEGISRALIQQWSRHRLQSQNVKSTRYTIDNMIREFIEQYNGLGYVEQALIDKYFVRFPYSEAIINEIIKQIALDSWDLNKANNDILKYCFPEALKTETISKMNLRSFINLYKLRSSQHAMKEFRELSSILYNSLPEYIKELVDIAAGENNE